MEDLQVIKASGLKAELCSNALLRLLLYWLSILSGLIQSFSSNKIKVQAICYDKPIYQKKKKCSTDVKDLQYTLVSICKYMQCMHARYIVWNFSMLHYILYLVLNFISVFTLLYLNTHIYVYVGVCIYTWVQCLCLWDHLCVGTTFLKGTVVDGEFPFYKKPVSFCF